MSKRHKKKHQVYMQIAHDISQLSTCDRKNVGALIVKNDRIVSMGYNGSVSGAKHCDEVGHLMADGHCKRSVHSEANALLYAKRSELKDGTIYVTCRPCIDCFTMIGNSGIREIIYDEPYSYGEEIDKEMYNIADNVGISIHQIDELLGEDT